MLRKAKSMHTHALTHTLTHGEAAIIRVRF